MDSRTQGSRLRSRTQKKVQGQEQPFRGQNFSRPRTKDTAGASVLQKKKVSKIFFRRSPEEENKKNLRKFSTRFLAFSKKILTVQKIVLSSSRGQGNFRGLEASRPRTSKCVLEAKAVASLRMVTPGAEFWDVTVYNVLYSRLQKRIFKK